MNVVRRNQKHKNGNSNNPKIGNGNHSRNHKKKINNGKHSNRNGKNVVRKNQKHKNGNGNHPKIGNRNHNRNHEKKIDNRRNNKNAWKTRPPTRDNLERCVCGINSNLCTRSWQKGVSVVSEKWRKWKVGIVS